MRISVEVDVHAVTCPGKSLLDIFKIHLIDR